MLYHIATYGCQMNVHESEKIAGVLEKLKFKKSDNISCANIVVFNTCCIRESAEQKIFAHIGALKKLKAERKDMIIAVCGCMTQQKNYAENLHKKFPFVDIIFGTHNIFNFEDFLKERLAKKKTIISINEGNEISLRDNMPIHRTNGVNAWINIMYGCNNFCSYCIVPFVRGREVSRKEEDIIKEIIKLVKSGYKQITLLGQNVNSYGNDLKSGDREKTSFAKLLSAIDKIPGKFRIRFMTSHPKDLSPDVIKVIQNSDKICHGLHLPVQSGSNKILSKMNRRYTREDYLKLIYTARKLIPDIQFTTDIIVGFPGETDEDFKDTLDLVNKVRFQGIFTFMYSKRKGTAAEQFENQIPLEIKKQRLRELINLQNQIGSEISESYTGTELEVLVEGVSPKNDKILMGSTDFGKTISFNGDRDNIGKFVKVKVTKSRLTTLFGEIIQEKG